VDFKNSIIGWSGFLMGDILFNNQSATFTGKAGARHPWKLGGDIKQPRGAYPPPG
jgi:hypothetical protein